MLQYGALMLAGAWIRIAVKNTSNFLGVFRVSSSKRLEVIALNITAQLKKQ